MAATWQAAAAHRRGEARSRRPHALRRRPGRGFWPAAVPGPLRRGQLGPARLSKGDIMTNANLSSWIDRTAFDPDGEEVGVIDDIYVDDATRQPEWLAIKTGRGGKGVSFVPLAGSGPRGDDVAIAHRKGLVDGAPGADLTGPLLSTRRLASTRTTGWSTPRADPRAAFPSSPPWRRWTRHTSRSKRSTSTPCRPHHGCAGAEPTRISTWSGSRPRMCPSWSSSRRGTDLTDLGGPSQGRRLRAAVA